MRYKTFNYHDLEAHPLTQKLLPKLGWEYGQLATNAGVVRRIKAQTPITLKPVMALKLDDHHPWLVLVESPLDVFHEYAWEPRALTEDQYAAWTAAIETP